MSSEVYILIPSRIGSTRLQDKPLIDLNGKTLIQRVLVNSLEVNKNSFVATDSLRIKQNIEKISNNVVMTSDSHISGTDRICEAANKLNLDENTFILNLQGDEPFLPKKLIFDVINDFFINECDVITVSNEIKSTDEIDNPNCVLVETDNNNIATKFVRTGKINNPRRHIGVYGYRLNTLNKLVNLKPTSNELELKLEQLRFLENNYSIYVTNFKGDIPHGIDTNEDVISAKRYLNENIK